MRWWVFILFAYLVVALQVGVADALAIPSRFGAIQPRLILLLAVFVGLSAAPGVALAAWVALGLVVDLVSPQPGVTLVGPYALGYLVAGYVLLQGRTMVFRQHPLTMGMMILVCGLAAHLVVVLVFSIRTWYDPLPGFSGGTELVRRFFSLLVTGLLGVILAGPIFRLAPVFGFHFGKTAGAGRRSR